MKLAPWRHPSPDGGAAPPSHQIRMEGYALLLTITYTGRETQNLGYLLHKNPYRAQRFELSFGRAYVFWPEVSDGRTTCALLLDIDPIDLARGKVGSKDGGLFDYVNDRPYVASSFMSGAIVQVFGTAMKGRCEAMQALADTPLNLTARVHNLPVRGGPDLPNKIFEPLGYAVSCERKLLDEKFPEWGDSPYVDLTLEGCVTLAALLNHLYVLIPAFDRKKHYHVGAGEVEKLLKHGEGWLASHPMRNAIAGRYLINKRALARKAIDRLIEEEATEEELESEIEREEEVLSSEEAPEAGDAGATEAPEAPEEAKEKKIPLNDARLTAVRDAVLECGAESVIDLGCGEGKLLALLLKEKGISRLVGADVSVRALELAKKRLRVDRLPSALAAKLTLMQASLTYKDDRFVGFDAACVVEVVEHLDPPRLAAFERVLFQCAAPRTVILTTPNQEYNARYAALTEGALRHEDHRFEWTRAEFKAWAERVAKAFGYEVALREIGAHDDEVGAPTQMGAFTRCA